MERNAIYNARELECLLKKSSISLLQDYPVWIVHEALVQSGVVKIVCKEHCTTKNLSKWRENQERSITLLRECGVEVEFY